MAGIYFHIPFCKTRCTYCDFYTTTQISHLSTTVQSLINELELRKHEFEGENVSTIYFGGGTPTLLKSNQLQQIIERVYQLFNVEKVGTEHILLALLEDDKTISSRILAALNIDFIRIPP